MDMKQALIEALMGGVMGGGASMAVNGFKNMGQMSAEDMAKLKAAQDAMSGGVMGGGQAMMGRYEQQVRPEDMMAQPFAMLPKYPMGR